MFSGAIPTEGLTSYWFLRKLKESHQRFVSSLLTPFENLGTHIFEFILTSTRRFTSQSLVFYLTEDFYGMQNK